MKKLEVHVAPAGGLCYIVRRTAEGLLPPKLATELLISLVSVCDEGLLHERFTPATALLAPNAFDMKEPKTATRHLMRKKALLSLLLLFRILYASLSAIMLMVQTHIIEDIVCEMM